VLLKRTRRFWVELEIENLDEIKDYIGNKMGLKVLRECIMTSPVVTGRLRAGYALKKDDEAYFIENQVKYANRIEYGFVGADSLGRFFHQSGQRIVHKAIEKVLKDGVGLG